MAELCRHRLAGDFSLELLQQMSVWFLNGAVLKPCWHCVRGIRLSAGVRSDEICRCLVMSVSGKVEPGSS